MPNKIFFDLKVGFRRGLGEFLYKGETFVNVTSNKINNMPIKIEAFYLLTLFKNNNQKEKNSVFKMSISLNVYREQLLNLINIVLALKDI